MPRHPKPDPGEHQAVTNLKKFHRQSKARAQNRRFVKAWYSKPENREKKCEQFRDRYYTDHVWTKESNRKRSERRRKQRDKEKAAWALVHPDIPWKDRQKFFGGHKKRCEICGLVKTKPLPLTVLLGGKYEVPCYTLLHFARAVNKTEEVIKNWVRSGMLPTAPWEIRRKKLWTYDQVAAFTQALQKYDNRKFTSHKISGAEKDVKTALSQLNELYLDPKNYEPKPSSLNYQLSKQAKPITPLPKLKPERYCPACLLPLPKKPDPITLLLAKQFKVRMYSITDAAHWWGIHKASLQVYFRGEKLPRPPYRKYTHGGNFVTLYTEDQIAAVREHLPLKFQSSTLFFQAAQKAFESLQPLGIDTTHYTIPDGPYWSRTTPKIFAERTLLSAKNRQEARKEKRRIAASQ
jgi:hypothetical protein